MPFVALPSPRGSLRGEGPGEGAPPRNAGRVRRTGRCPTRAGRGRLREARPSVQPLDVAGGAREDLLDPAEPRLVAVLVHGCTEGGAAEVAERAADDGHRGPEEERAQLVDAAEDVVDGPLVCLEVLPPLVGDLEDLPVALLGLRARVAEILQQRQRGIHRAGARAVGAGEAVLQLLDDLVAVTRLLGQEAEDDVLQVAMAEHPAATGALRPSPARP